MIHRADLVVAAVVMAACLTPAGVRAQADARWEPLFSDGMIAVRLDTHTVRRDTGAVMTVWTEWRLPAVREIGSTGQWYDSVKSQDDVDCARIRFRPVREQFYLGREAVGTPHVPGFKIWREPVPDSMIDTLVRRVCAWAGFR
jgi:hypothetical protein